MKIYHGNPVRGAFFPFTEMRGASGDTVDNWLTALPWKKRAGSRMSRLSWSQMLAAR